MNSDNIFDALGDIQDEFIADAARPVRPRRRSKAVRTGLIAAVAAIFLSISAYAIYQATAADMAVMHWGFDRLGEDTWIYSAAPVGTKEHQAEAAWWSYYRDNWDILTEDGEFHFYEPVNLLYWSDPGAGEPETYSQEAKKAHTAGNKLREIAEEYDLRLWNTCCAWFPPERMEELLGIDASVWEAMDDSGLVIDVYDDGGMAVRNIAVTLPDGDTGIEAVFRAMKGTLSLFALLGDDPATMESEVYTTADGKTVVLVTGETNCRIFADLENCYVTVHLYPALSLAALEKFTDTIDFDSLDAPVPGGTVRFPFINSAEPHTPTVFGVQS